MFKVRVIYNINKLILNKEILGKQQMIDDVKATVSKTVDIASEFLKSSDVFEATTKIFGKTVVGTYLSKYNCGQVGSLFGVVVSHVAPQLALSLLMRKISQDLESLKSSMEVVRYKKRKKNLLTLIFLIISPRNCPQYLATQYFANVLRKIQNHQLLEVLLQKIIFELFFIA